MSELTLCEMENDTLDFLIGLPIEDKHAYFIKLVETYYPKALADEKEKLIENYISSIYVEKLYRSNRFFNEQFTMVYTQTGVIRNIINDIYFIEDDLITH